MRWVTYFEDAMIMDGKVADIVVHKDKESSTKYFKAHYRDYFQLNSKRIEVKLPMRYGFPFCAFYGVSLLKLAIGSVRTRKKQRYFPSYKCN